MTSSSLNPAAYDVNLNVITTQKNYKTSDNKADFGKYFDQASQNIVQSSENWNNNSTQNKISDTKSEKDSFELKEEQKVEDDLKKENDFSEEKIADNKSVKEEEVSLEDEVVDEETSKEIVEAISQIIEQIKSILGISDEELLSGMETIGLQMIDLLNPDNMPQLLVAITGEESNISLVTNENLYASLQEILQNVEESVSTLVENTGLSNEELDNILQKIQLLENTKETNAKETNTEDIINISDNEKILVDANVAETEAVKQEKNSIMTTDNNNTSTSEIKDDFTNIKVDVEDTSHGEKQENRDLGQQNSFANNFQNEQSEIAQLTSENRISSYTSESTENIMRQIADMVKIVKNEQLTEMELQLHPASLGNVKVSLATKGGVVTAEFITQNEAVKNAIEAQAVQLKANLEEQGVKIEAIEVSVASHQMERNLEQNNKDNAQDGREQDEKYIQGIRKNSINFNSFEDGDELLDELQNADEATRIAMEMMAINGNSMDLMA